MRYCFFSIICNKYQNLKINSLCLLIKFQFSNLNQSNKIILQDRQITLYYPMPKFEVIKPQIELNLKKLVNKVKDVLQNACTLVKKRQIEPSYNQCQGTSNKICVKEFKNDSCLTEGVLISNNSGVRYPFTNLQNMTVQNKIITSATTQLDSSLRNIKQLFTNTIERVYFGLETGLFRAFPGTQQNCTLPYDPRDRPWYVAGLTGSKKICIVINLTSPLTQEQLKNVKIQVQKLINSLSINDYIGVIVRNLSNQMEIIQSTKLDKAQDSKKGALIQQIKKLELNSLQPIGINETFAYLKNKSLFGSSNQSGECLTSSKILHLINLRAGEETEQTLKQINQWTHQESILINSFSFSNQNNSIFRNLSCSSYGAFYQISRTRDITSAIRQYQRLLSHFVNIDQPNWTEPYYDAPTGKRMITAYMPIYFYQSSGRRIIRTAGIDVTMSNLQINDISEQYVKSFVKCSPSVKIQLKKQVVECLKDKQSQCLQSNCSFYRKSIVGQCQFPEQFKIFEDPPLKNAKSVNNVCCSIQVASFKIILIIVGLAILFFIFSFFAYKLWKKNQIVAELNRTQPTRSQQTQRTDDQSPASSQNFHPNSKNDIQQKGSHIQKQETKDTKDKIEDIVKF